jgi:hypothetical protein
MLILQILSIAKLRKTGLYWQEFKNFFSSFSHGERFPEVDPSWVVWNISTQYKYIYCIYKEGWEEALIPALGVNLGWYKNKLPFQLDLKTDRGPLSVPRIRVGVALRVWRGSRVVFRVLSSFMRSVMKAQNFISSKLCIIVRNWAKTHLAS